MKRIDDDTIALTQQELDDIHFFIRNSLERDWDRHTDHYICSDPLEVGMRRMDPEMYDFAERMLHLEVEASTEVEYEEPLCDCGKSQRKNHICAYS